MTVICIDDPSLILEYSVASQNALSLSIFLITVRHFKHPICEQLLTKKFEEVLNILLAKQLGI